MTTFGVSAPMGRLGGLILGKHGGLGYATGNITLKSECVNGEQAEITIRYHVAYGSVGLPLVATGGKISFEDYNNHLSTGQFNGHISFASGGIATPIIGGNFIAIQVGSVSTIGPGVVFGLDAGLGDYIGTAEVIRSTRRKCDCK